MTKKPALGRGLSALIPSARADAEGAGLKHVEVERLEANCHRQVILDHLAR